MITDGAGTDGQIELEGPATAYSADEDPSGPARASTAAPTRELQALIELHDQGVVDDEDFERLRARIEHRTSSTH